METFVSGLIAVLSFISGYHWHKAMVKEERENMRKLMKQIDDMFDKHVEKV